MDISSNKGGIATSRPLKDERFFIFTNRYYTQKAALAAF